MDLIQLTPSAYHLRDGSNTGLIVAGDKAILIDTGLDKDSARKILRAVDSLGLALVAVVITHAHADHFGGAATVRARAHVPVYAAPLEAAVVANPILEPLYLFSGAAPAAELRHKFTLAEPCPVDQLLMPGEASIEGIALQVIPAPGHAPEQVLIAGGGVCFAGDACFAPPIMRKHGIPFYVDIDRAAASLRVLAGLDGDYQYFVPGHGEAVANISPWVEQNLAHLAAIRAAVASALAESGELSRIVELAATRMGVSIANPVIYWLTQTTVLACLERAAGRRRGNGDGLREPAGLEAVWRLAIYTFDTCVRAHYNSTRFHPFRFEDLSMAGQARSSCLSSLESSTRGEDFVKHLRFFSALLVCVTLVGLLAACAPAAPSGPSMKFAVATDASFPPMEFVDANKSLVGFDVELLTAIAKDQKFEVDIKNTAWDGIFAGLEAGQYDAIISSVTITPEREQKYAFSAPYFDANQGIVVRADENGLKTPEELKGKNVGAQIGTTGAFAVNKIGGVSLKEYDTPDLAMQDLVNKNLDAVVVDYPVAANFALQSDQFKGKLKMSGQLVTNEKYGMTVQKGDPKGFLPLFNKGLANLKANGTYDQIYAKWIGSKPAAASGQ